MVTNFGEPSIGLMQAGLPCSIEDERLDEGTSRVIPAISETQFNCHCNALRFDHLREFVCLMRCSICVICHGSRTTGSGVTGRSDAFTIAGWKDDGIAGGRKDFKYSSLSFMEASAYI
jgi:hypothetical protein